MFGYISRNIYYKYLIPLLLLMAMAVLLGFIAISILVANNIENTGIALKEGEVMRMSKEILVKHQHAIQTHNDAFVQNIENTKYSLKAFTNYYAFKSLRIAKMRTYADQTVRYNNQLLEIALFDKKGKEVFSHCLSEKPFAADLKDCSPQYLMEQLPPKTAYISKVFFDKTQQRSYLYIGYLINHINGKNQFSLLAKVALDNITETIANKTVNQQGRMFLVDYEQQILFENPSTEKAYRYQNLPVDVKANIIQYPDTTIWNKAYLLSTATNQYGWTTVYYTPHALAYQAIKERVSSLSEMFGTTRQNILLFSVLAILLIVSFATFAGVKVAKSITNPILKLIHATRDVARGNFQVTIQRETQDEVGELAESFTNMTWAIQKYQEELLERTRLIEIQAQQLTASNEDLERYAHTVSHDLKEPLRMVNGYVKLMHKKLEHQLDSETKEYMDFAMDGTQRMSRIINDLLAYARFEEKSKRQKFEAVDLNDIIAIVKKDLLFLTKEHEAQIGIIPDKLPVIKGKFTQIHQLFQNVIANAIKYRRAANPIIKIDAILKDNTCEIIIIDNGRGIAKADIPKVFMPFKRLVARQEVEGSGIGLATVKKIMDHHNGNIKIESEVGIGTTFYFTFEAATKLPTPPSKVNKKEKKTNTILRKE